MSLKYNMDDWSNVEIQALVSAMAFRKSQEIHGWTEDEMYEHYDEMDKQARNAIRGSKVWGTTDDNGFTYDDAFLDSYGERVLMYLREL